MRFFKAGKGQYGEGDSFIGVTVPEQRTVALRYRELPLPEIKRLLASGIHEHRLTALLILDYKREKASRAERAAIAKFYLTHRAQVNNWDLVDSSARELLGAELYETGGSRALLDRLARSKSLWDRRIAIIATYYFIGKGEYADTLRIARALIDDREDLMHKATGWMLREVGKRSERELTRFLDRHAAIMPRTMLRYALERLSSSQKLRYMAKKGLRA
jgi:3-methyladenine DNA glycosylase AlkD